MAFIQGSFVRLHGLKNAKQYNGIVGIVLNDKKKNNDGDDRYPVQLLDHQSSWNEDHPEPSLECGGKILTVKEVNLEPSRDSTHWRIPNFTDARPPISIHELVSTRCDHYKEIGDLDDCEEFCQAVWDQFFETLPSFSFDRNNQREICSASVKGHKVFWLRCDAIMHHMLIEKSWGRYRVFQAYIDIYSGREWSDMKKEWHNTPNNVPTCIANVPCYKKYGGGRTVGATDIQTLIGNIGDIQDLIPSLTPHLLKNIPGITKKDVKDIRLFQQTGSRKTLQLVKAVQRITSITCPWSRAVLNNVGPLGITIVGVLETNDGRLVYDHDSSDGSATISILQGNNMLFDIPIHLYKEVQKSNCALTGQVFLNPAIFVRLVNCGLVWANGKDPVTGGAHGFGFQGANIDMKSSYEEGVEQSEEIRTKMMKDYSKYKINALT